MKNLLFFSILLISLSSCSRISILLISNPFAQKDRALIKYHQKINQFRSDKKKEFNESSHAPLKGAELDSMRFFDINPAFRVIASVELLENQGNTIIKTSSGKEKAYTAYAKLTFELDSKPYTLTAYTINQLKSIPKFKDLIFLMFNDDTNGDTTYGGGRYIDLSKTDIKNGSMVIDFNKAYHPYCHYSSGYNCPIPPAENYIDVAIEAGEKNYVGQYKGEH